VQGPVTHLLYLHGFRSSPKSFKAERLKAWLAAHQPQVHWWCPQLPPSPREAMALLRQGLAGWPRATSCCRVRKWRHATRASTLRVVQGSDHALSDFDKHLPSLLKHLALCD
jgi:predicted esterase YcpF (UPF0227 family)